MNLRISKSNIITILLFLRDSILQVIIKIIFRTRLVNLSDIVCFLLADNKSVN